MSAGKQLSFAILICLAAFVVLASAAHASIITGSVRDSADNPVVGVQITLSQAQCNWGGGRESITTDSAGNFRVENLAPGSYYLLARCSGICAFVNPQFELWYNGDGGVQDCGRAAPIQVGENAEQTVSFQIGIGGNSISGFVTANGVPVGNIRIEIMDYDAGQWVAGVETSDEGIYTASVPQGRYRVRVCGTCNGRSYGEIFYNNRHLHEEADPVTVGQGEQVRGIDFALTAISMSLSLAATTFTAGQPINIHLGVIGDDYTEVSPYIAILSPSNRLYMLHYTLFGLRHSESELKPLFPRWVMTTTSGDISYLVAGQPPAHEPGNYRIFLVLLRPWDNIYDENQWIGGFRRVDFAVQR